jgi:hypothetical protein
VLNRLPFAALAVAVGAAIVPAKASGPKVACDPGKITIESFDEGEAILDCFIGEEDHEPTLWITPSLQGILSAEVLSAVLEAGPFTSEARTAAPSRSRYLLA